MQDSIAFTKDGHNGKHHRHRCHHHNHHRHGHGHSSKMKEGRVHKRTCPKYKMSLEAVKVKKEPMDEDSGSIRQLHSSHTRLERRRATSEDGRDDHVVRHEGRQAGRSEDRESREGRANRSGRRRVLERRRNRWGNEEENATSTSWPVKQEQNGEGGELYDWGKKADPPKEEKIIPGQKDKRNFNLSGKLAEDTNTFNGVVIKYTQPPEARKPKRRWRFYPFKGDKGLPTLYIHRQSSYLIGRDRKVADIPVDHPSCSKQHAALQYRLVPFSRENGTMGKRVRPYIIDLESSNGTYVNSVKIEPRTYVELLEKDVIKFGYSSREYVLLHEQSKDEQLDDDVTMQEIPECVSSK